MSRLSQLSPAAHAAASGEFAQKDTTAAPIALSFAADPLSRATLNPSELQTILRQVAQKPNVHSLNLQGNFIPARSVPVLANFIGASRSLRHLDVSQCGLGDPSAAMLLRATAQNKHSSMSSRLQSINFSFNMLTDETCQVLHELATTSCLRQIGLAFNAITLSGVDSLLTFNSQFNKIDLRYCGLPAEDPLVNLLCKRLKSMARLRTLHLEGNGFKKTQYEKVQKSLENKPLKNGLSMGRAAGPLATVAEYLNTLREEKAAKDEGDEEQDQSSDGHYHSQQAPEIDPQIPPEIAKVFGTVVPVRIPEQEKRLTSYDVVSRSRRATSAIRVAEVELRLKKKAEESPKKTTAAEEEGEGEGEELSHRGVSAAESPGDSSLQRVISPVFDCTPLEGDHPSSADVPPAAGHAFVRSASCQPPPRLAAEREERRSASEHPEAKKEEENQTVNDFEGENYAPPRQPQVIEDQVMAAYHRSSSVASTGRGRSVSVHSSRRSASAAGGSYVDPTRDPGSFGVDRGPSVKSQLRRGKLAKLLLERASVDDYQALDILNLDSITDLQAGGGAAFDTPSRLVRVTALPSELERLTLCSKERVNGLAKLLFFVLYAPGDRVPIDKVVHFKDLPTAILHSPGTEQARYRSIRTVENNAARRRLAELIGVSNITSEASPFRPPRKLASQRSLLGSRTPKQSPPPQGTATQEEYPEIPQLSRTSSGRFGKVKPRYLDSYNRTKSSSSLKASTDALGM